MMEEATKKDQTKADQETVGKEELDLDSLDQVTGGANPFAKYSRVPNQSYDDSVKGKV